MGSLSLVHRVPVADTVSIRIDAGGTTPSNRCRHSSTNNGSLTLTIGYGPCARAVKAVRNGSGRGWDASTGPPWRRPAIVPETILLAVSICLESFAVDHV